LIAVLQQISASLAGAWDEEMESCRTPISPIPTNYQTHREAHLIPAQFPGRNIMISILQLGKLRLRHVPKKSAQGHLAGS
jgi:hypothetical protein